MPVDPAPAGLRKLQDAFFDVSLPAQATVVHSSLASGLSAYLRSFNEKTPDYSGGQYLFLRISPERLDVLGDGDDRYEVFAAETTDSAARPKLRLSFRSETPDDAARYWRVGYGHSGPVK